MQFGEFGEPDAARTVGQQQLNSLVAPTYGAKRGRPSVAKEDGSRLPGFYFTSLPHDAAQVSRQDAHHRIGDWLRRRQRGLGAHQQVRRRGIERARTAVVVARDDASQPVAGHQFDKRLGRMRPECDRAVAEPTQRLRRIPQRLAIQLPVGRMRQLGIDGDGR